MLWHWNLCFCMNTNVKVEMFSPAKWNEVVTPCYSNGRLMKWFFACVLFFTNSTNHLQKKGRRKTREDVIYTTNKSVRTYYDPPFVG